MVQVVPVMSYNWVVRERSGSLVQEEACGRRLLPRELVWRNPDSGRGPVQVTDQGKEACPDRDPRYSAPVLLDHRAGSASPG